MYIIKTDRAEYQYADFLTAIRWLDFANAGSLPGTLFERINGHDYELVEIK